MQIIEIEIWFNVTFFCFFTKIFAHNLIYNGDILCFFAYVWTQNQIFVDFFLNSTSSSTCVFIWKIENKMVQLFFLNSNMFRRVSKKIDLDQFEKWIQMDFSKIQMVISEIRINFWFSIQVNYLDIWTDPKFSRKIALNWFKIHFSSHNRNC